jgi:hypothetical protein
MRGAPLVRTAVIVCGAMAWPEMVSAQPKSQAILRPGTATVQGFSVVLLLGDLQGGTTADNVPTAARKALVDMKDFLPYRSYRLLDTAWILGSIESRATVRLRGSENQEYELHLTSDPMLGPRAPAQRPALRMSFQLGDAGVDGPAAGYAASLEGALRNRLREQQRSIGELESRLSNFDRDNEKAEKQLEGVTDPAERRDAQSRRQELRLAIEHQLSSARERLKSMERDSLSNGSTVGRAQQQELEGRKTQLADLETRRAVLEEQVRGLRSQLSPQHPRILSAQAELDRATRDVATAREAVRQTSGRRIIDTSFSMDVGETVVVGTSRLGGGDKAIIALLTAVPREVRK